MSKKEKTEGQKLADKLTFTQPHIYEEKPELFKEAVPFCEGYKAFLNKAKTEREFAIEAEKLLKDAGYQLFEKGKAYKAGEKVYFVNRKKAVLAVTFGKKPLSAGIHISVAHVDSPRLDLKPNPLYEDADFALLKTHYYGGLRKYQWGVIPLALHGVVVLKNGKTVKICVGEDENDPIFCVNDLLPHLAGEQSKRPLAEGLKGEELNIVVGSLPYEDEEVKDRVKLFTLQLLNEKYGMTERDFVRAEIEAIPAYKAKDVGFDRSMIGAYGQDDKVCAYTALMAEIEAKDPAFTTLCVLTDKEEIGSDGNTGLNSDYVFHFIASLCDNQGGDYKETVAASKCLSADVNAAFDPTFASVYEKKNAAYCNRGCVITKYTGARGKYDTSDASAEMMGYVADMLDDAGVYWQTGELGAVDAGGGGTVAKYVADHNIDVVDIGVPILSMHAPFELSAKLDVYMAYKAFKAFTESQK